MFVRKKLAGSDSHGHVWDADGAVVEVDDWQGFDLLSIVDAGFTEVHPDEVAAITEPAPETATPVAETPPAADDNTTPIDEAPAKPTKRTGRRAAE